MHGSPKPPQDGSSAVSHLDTPLENAPNHLARRVATASRGAKAPVADSAALADASAGGAPDRDGERDEDGGLHGRNSCCTFCV